MCVAADKRTAASGPTDLGAHVDRLTSLLSGGATAAARADLRRLDRDLTSDAESRQVGSYERGMVDGLLAVVRAVARNGMLGGLAAQVAPFEPGSLAARLLLEIAAGVHGANADLAERLDTDQWQISRAGRRLRDLGFAQRSRSGRTNEWALTAAGDQEVASLQGSRGK